MTTSDMVKNKLLDLVSQLRSQKMALHKQLELIDGDLGALERTLNLLYGNELPNKTDDTTQLKFIDDVNSISNARNQMEAIKIIACQNNWMVNATKVSDILIRAGKAKGKRRNLVATIYSMLSNSDEWEKVSPGTFRLVTPAE